MSARINKYREDLLGYLQMNKHIVRAKGHQLEDSDGHTYLDCLSQYGALPFGHNPDFIIEAVQQHMGAERACLVQPLFSEEARALAERLRQAISPQYKYCLFTNSGTETVEAAIKLARLRSDRKAILSLEGSFHGKTYASLSATSSSRHKNELIADYQAHTIIPPDLERIRSELAGQRYAAILLEPVQGEGGMRPFGKDWLEAVIAIAHEQNTLVIFDEVQTGLGRCGEITISQTLAELPDILLLSKALGGGVMPIGAMLYRQALYISAFDKKHSSTFAGNGLAAAVGIAVIDELMRDDQQRLQHVRTLTRTIESELERLREMYPKLLDFSGCGLMWSLKIRDENGRENMLVSFLQGSGGLSHVICSYLMNRRGLYTMPLLSEPCAIRYEPPLDTTQSEVFTFLDAIREVCSLIAHGRYDILMAHLAGVDSEELSSPGRIYSVSPISVHTCNHHAASPHLPNGKRFAFFMHVTSVSDLLRGFPVAIKREYSEAARERLARLLIAIGRTEYSPEVAYEFRVHGRHSQSDGVLIFSPIDSADMMKLPPREKKILMDEFLQVARREQVELIGLGAYTSVITRAGELLDTSMNDLAVTTGNSITAMSTLDALSELIQPQQASGMKAAIIGARGSVGRLIALGMSHHFGHITLVGRSGSEEAVLDTLLDDLCDLAIHTVDQVVPGSVLDKIRCRLGEDLSEIQDNGLVVQPLDAYCEQMGISVCAVEDFDMSEMDCIVSSTSEGKPFLKSRFKPDAIVFDVARPFDFMDTQDSSRILEGGLVRQPQAVAYTDCNLIGTPEGVNLGCLSETIALALDSAKGHFSIGKSIPYAQARSIYQTARNHGFSSHSYR